MSERYSIGRICIVCKEGFNLLGPGDPRTICPDCCNVIKNIRTTAKALGFTIPRAGSPTITERQEGKK